jgi:hypothetical protein
VIIPVLDSYPEIPQLADWESRGGRRSTYFLE